MERVFVPYLVYKNVLLMMEKYRHLKVIDDVIPEAKFRQDIQYDGAVVINAIDDELHRPREPTNTVVSVMGVNSKYIKAVADFKMHITHVLNDYKKREKNSDTKLEIVIISPDKLSTHIKKKIVDLSKGGIRILTYSYDVFKAEITKHKNNDPYELLSGEEVEKLMEDLAAEPHYLPILRSQDPTAIWYGFEKGDVVRVRAISENAGRKIIYRYVI